MCLTVGVNDSALVLVFFAGVTNVCERSSVLVDDEADNDACVCWCSFVGIAKYSLSIFISNTSSLSLSVKLRCVCAAHGIIELFVDVPVFLFGLFNSSSLSVPNNSFIFSRFFIDSND